VSSSHYIVNMGRKIRISCNYTGKIKWFFMRNPQVPDRPPKSWAETFHITTDEYDSGFYICMGSRGDGKKYISKFFLEVISKLVIGLIYSFTPIEFTSILSTIYVRESQIL